MKLWMTFLNIVQSYPLRTFNLIIFNILFLVFLSSTEGASNFILEQWGNGEKQVSFEVLVGKLSTKNDFLKKVRSLPGVVRVEKVSDKVVHEKIQKILKKIEGPYLEIFEKNSYFAFSVFVDPILDSRTIDLMKDYLVKLSGEENTHVGDVQKSQTHNEQIIWFSNFISSWIMIAAMSVVWMAVNLLFFKSFNQMGFIIQSYSRDKKIFLKIFLTLFTFSTFVAFISSQSFGFFNPVVLLCLFTVGVLLIIFYYWRHRWHVS